MTNPLFDIDYIVHVDVDGEVYIEKIRGISSRTDIYQLPPLPETNSSWHSPKVTPAKEEHRKGILQDLHDYIGPNALRDIYKKNYGMCPPKKLE